jgi:hypothetical protein
MGVVGRSEKLFPLKDFYQNPLHQLTSRFNRACVDFTVAALVKSFARYAGTV